MSSKYLSSIIGTLSVTVIVILLFHMLSGEQMYILGDDFVELDEGTYDHPVSLSETKFGFPVDQYHFETFRLNYGDVLGKILSNNGISAKKIDQLAQKSKDTYDIRNIKAGKKCHLIKKDSCADRALAFVYEPNPLAYVLFDLRDSVKIDIVERDYQTRIVTASGEIKTSLWNSMIDQNINPAVIDLMEDALASNVSFYHTKKGDQYKVVYEQKYIDDEPVGLGRMIGAYYKNKYGSYYSIFYENELYAGFYDEEGRPSKKAFLKSPIKGGARISSRYNLRRFHPIKKRRIPHLGTDYAAPYGTPIRSVADGVITVVAYKRNNGKYVKIRHDKTYESQYLHMQKFAKGIRPGVNVSQGTIIGYVGSTGLATGPHVCFRFWKNGKQIDHLRENFPPAEPMPKEELPKFYEVRDSVKAILDNVLLPSERVEKNPLL